MRTSLSQYPQPTLVTVRTPSLRRFRTVFRNSRDKSILRCLEYERLASLGLVGRVLDFGGGRETNYSARINHWGDPDQGYTYESANIDPKTEPTYLISPGAPLPVEDGAFDAIISFNTFEHIFDLRGTFTELGRILRPDGRLVFIVPFIFRVHGHPSDYTRCTPSFWSAFLADHGFEDVEIEAMTWGPFSTGATVSGMPGPFKVLRRNVALLLDVLYAALRYGQDIRKAALQDAPVCNAPLAYLVQARRR